MVSVPAECDVIKKERLNGTYRLSAYWLAKMTSEVPLLLVAPTILGTIIYFTAGLPNDAGIFFLSRGVTYVIYLLGQARCLCKQTDPANF